MNTDPRVERNLTILLVIVTVLAIIAMATGHARGAQRGPVTTYKDGCWTTPLHCGRIPNGKCPVCGTVSLMPDGSLHHDGLGVLTRCPKCNAAFWQDPEDK